MFDAIIQFVCPSFPATFTSDYSLAASVERFQNVLHGYMLFEGVPRASLVGQVTGQSVQLHQFGWGGQGRYPMVFSGEFRQTKDGVVLAGHFALRLSSRLWLGFFLGFLSLAIVGLVLQAARGLGTLWWEPVCALGALVISLAVIGWGQRTSSNRPWLAQVIASVLTRQKA